MLRSPSQKTMTTRPPKSTAILLILTVLSTTLRAFVPTIGGTLLGVALDKLFDQAPVFTVAMIVLGFATSIVLIILQIRRLK